MILDSNGCISCTIVTIIVIIAFVTIEAVLLYSNFIMYKALVTVYSVSMDAVLVKTWTLGHNDIYNTLALRTQYFICHNALVPMS